MGEKRGMIVKKYSAEDEAFYRGLKLPVEDVPPGTPAGVEGAFRWFRSPNIVCLEQYQRSRAAPIQRTKPAA
jgi:hypothetical protein